MRKLPPETKYPLIHDFVRLDEDFASDEEFEHDTGSMLPGAVAGFVLIVGVLILAWVLICMVVQ